MLNKSDKVTMETVLYPLLMYARFRLGDAVLQALHRTLAAIDQGGNENTKA